MTCTPRTSQRAVAAMRKAGFEDMTARLYLRPDGTPLQAGDVWRQPDLARTLEIIATQGARAFYEGPLAQALASVVQKLGGLWTAADLAQYQAIERGPRWCSMYLGHRIINDAAPVVRRDRAARDPRRERAAAHARSAVAQRAGRSISTTEAARRAFADRGELLGDPGLRRRCRSTKLTSMAYVNAAHGGHRSADTPRRRPDVSGGAGATRRHATPPTTRSWTTRATRSPRYDAQHRLRRTKLVDPRHRRAAQRRDGRLREPARDAQRVRPDPERANAIAPASAC